MNYPQKFDPSLRQEGQRFNRGMMAFMLNKVVDYAV